MKNDHELITEDWLESVGFVPDETGIIAYEIPHDEPDDDYVGQTFRVLKVEGDRWCAELRDTGDPPHEGLALAWNLYTRGDVRRLCNSLEIYLNTQT